MAGKKRNSKCNFMIFNILFSSPPKRVPPEVMVLLVLRELL